MWDKAVAALISLAMTSVAGIIAFFLRRTMARVDANEAEIGQIKETYARKADLEKLQSSNAAQYARLEGRMNVRFDKIDHELKGFRDGLITREDFFREIMDQRKRNERIYDILLEIKGEKKNG